MRSAVAAFVVVLGVSTHARAQTPERPSPPGAIHGARLLAAGHAALEASAGFNVLLPTIVLGATTGLAHGVDVGLRYEVHGGLGHVFLLAGRAALGRSFALGLQVAQGFFAAEKLFGIRFVEAPFGTALVTTPRLSWSFEASPGAHLGFTLGVTARWIVLEQRAEETRRVVEPGVQDVNLEIVAEWDVSGGTTFLRFVALVPVQAELGVLGFLPTIVAGRTWGLP